MKNIFKTSLVLFACMVANVAVYAESFTATEIAVATAKSGITASANYFSKTNKQICKDGSATVKAEKPTPTKHAQTATAKVNKLTLPSPNSLLISAHCFTEINSLLPLITSKFPHVTASFNSSYFFNFSL